MNLFLFTIYIVTIIVLIISLTITYFSGRAYIPRKWLILFITFFITLIGGLIILLTAELIAPYNSKFYINPLLYLTYFALIGTSMMSVFLLVFEIHFKHIKLLKIAGYLLFLIIIFFLISSGVLFLLFEFSYYPWTAYLAFECVYGLGIITYILLAKGSFAHMSSNRLEKNVRTGLILVGVFSIGIVIGLILMSIGLFYIDFSIALNPFVAIYWLVWLCFVAIVFIIMFKRAISLFT